MKRLLTPSRNWLVLRLERGECRYVVTSFGKDELRVLAMGTCPIDPSESWSKQLVDRLAADKISASQAVVVLPRSELELVNLKLPPATESELPDLVMNLISSSIEDHAERITVDFVVSRELAEGQREALAFACADSKLQQLASELKSAGVTLKSVTASGFGAVHLLRQATQRPTRLAVVVTSQDHEIDMVVVEHDRPIFFRTLVGVAGDEGSLVDTLATEIDRTLTLVGHQLDESERIVLVGGLDEQQETATQLSERLNVPVGVVNPLEKTHGSALNRNTPVSGFAALLGVAQAARTQSLEMDLLNPRRPPAPPNPWRRVAMWAALVLVALGTLGWELSRRQSERAEELAELRAEVSKLTKEANKYNELRSVVDTVGRWRGHDINWLDELSHLSEVLPPGNQAVVRSLTMNSLPNGNAAVALALNVAQPEVRSQLEDALRDAAHNVSSHRVSEAAQQQRFPWQFETTIELMGRPHTHVSRATPVAAQPLVTKAAAGAGEAQSRGAQ